MLAAKTISNAQHIPVFDNLRGYLFLRGGILMILLENFMTKLSFIIIKYHYVVIKDHYWQNHGKR